LTHAGVLLARTLGSSVLADGFSVPYRIAMAFATAMYGFLSLLLSFRLARQYVEQRWALLATFSIWWASSLPVYMYFNPSWSHAHSAFAVALFVWYWHETRASRSLAQWFLLALIAGLMIDVYYANATVLVILAVEAIPQYLSVLRRDSRASVENPTFSKLLFSHLFFALMLLVSTLPILLAIPIGMASLPMETAFSSRSPRFSFSALRFLSSASPRSFAPAEPRSLPPSCPWHFSSSGTAA